MTQKKSGDIRICGDLKEPKKGNRCGQLPHSTHRGTIFVAESCSAIFYSRSCKCLLSVSRFRVPSRLPLLSCYVDSSWIGQSVPIVQQVCTDHELTLPHLSLIPHLPYMSLCLLLVVSRLSCLCTYCHSPVYLSPSAADLNAR